MNSDADPRAVRRAQNAETQRMRRANRGALDEENDQRRARRIIPGVMDRESAQRSVAREGPGVRERESTHRAVAREEPGVRERESAQRAATREDGTRREEENNLRRGRRSEMGVRQRETIQRAAAREETGVRERETRQRAGRTFDMACKYVDGNYLFHQPCGLWNEPCIHGCGYLHLSSSSAGTRKKCCANGRLSSSSENFDEELMMDHELDRLPKFLRLLIFSYSGFSQKSSTYNNLVAMAATAVCNYTNTNGFTRRGNGPQSVFMNGRVHHYMRIASTTSQNCGISYFIFDDIAALAGSADRQNVDPTILSDICHGLKYENSYCRDLRFLGVEARHRAEGNIVIPRMVDQVQHFDVCSVVNNRQTGAIKLQVRTNTGSVSDINMDSEKVEGLCFPLLFPRAEPGYTNASKSRLSPDEYVMARLLRPEKIRGKYMTASAPQPPYLCIDSRTGEPFTDTEDACVVQSYQVPDVFINRSLRVNRFMLMARLAQYWLMDFYSRVLDQRMSIVRRMKTRIMMGQNRQPTDTLTEHEEQDRRAAGYVDIPKEESYLPSSVHGSPRHMTALARNALILVSEFGCPHVFITLTCNPKWPEIVSQLLPGQTAFDRPDVTAAVFKSRLDLMKMNLRNGKYFDGCELTYHFHVIEYQYRGLPHAHLVARFEEAYDIDDPNRANLLYFVNKHFIAEMPRFEGEDYQNIFALDGVPEYTDFFKRTAVEMVRMNNTHKCAMAVNGCKKEADDKCRRGYGCTDIILDTYVNESTNRIVYRRRMECDLMIVPYNLQMMMDWDSHINVEYSGSAYCALYLYKYCYKGAARKERIDLSFEQEHDSLDEIKLFIYGRIMCSMSAVWRMYGYQDYPAPEPAVCAFKVRTGAQLKDFIQRKEVTDLQIYYNRPEELESLRYTEFLQQYNTSSQLPKYYADNPQSLDNLCIQRHYFKVYMEPDQEIRYVYRPVRQVKRCVRIEMLFVTGGDIFYLRLILLNRKARSDKDVLTYNPIRGGGEPLVCNSYQQSAIAHGYVDSVDDVRETFNDMCSNGTGCQCRSYFVVLTLHGYATHAIFDDYEKKRFMFMDYIIMHGVIETVAEQMMLQDLERKFRKSQSSMEKYGFPTPHGVPTELEEAITHWKNEQMQERQNQLLEHLNQTYPNNPEQQIGFDAIMESIINFSTANREDLIQHEFHFIGGPGGTGKSALFKKLHAACRKNGILITICAQSSLAALTFDGATTAHSLFSYPVEDEDDIDDQNLPRCNFKKERCDFLHEVSVIFWDEFISNDRILIEAVLDEFKTRWKTPRFYVFVCAGDFAQVSNYLEFNPNHLLLQ